MTVRCPNGHLWTVEQEHGGVHLSRPGAVTYISRTELSSLTRPGFEGLRPCWPGTLTSTEFREGQE